MRVPATIPYFSDDDINFIKSNFHSILKGDSYLSMYKHGEYFEEKFADYTKTKYAVACNSGTSALELIFRSIDVDGKEVILPSNTFLATAIAIMNAGGIPVFADCSDDMCLDVDDVIARVNDKTSAVTIVHIGGLLSERIFELKEFCERRGIYLVEDAAQAHGSSLKGVKAGAFGIASGFSFFSTKVMTTGEGGIVTTNAKDLADKMKSMREFGKLPRGNITNYHEYFGYNWRMPEVSALMGIRQLEKLEKFKNRRQEIAKRYNNNLGEIEGIRKIQPMDFLNHNFFKYTLVLEKYNRNLVHKLMEEANISPSGYVYEIPLHKQPVFKEHNSLSLPKTEYLCSKHFCLPIFYSMTNEQVDYVSEKFINILDTID